MYGLETLMETLESLCSDEVRNEVRGSADRAKQHDELVKKILGRIDEQVS